VTDNEQKKLSKSHPLSLRFNNIISNSDENVKDYPSLIKKAGLNGFKKITTSTKPSTGTTTKPTVKTYKKGDAVKLSGALLYASATDKKVRARKSGTYYIYDGKEQSGRYRVTIKKSFCGKWPMALFVTGWVSKTDIK